GNEPVGSLGYDGPLAALNPEKPNLSEFFKETVAVVTNPAIDREREIEHFSTRVILGRRPLPNGQGAGRVEELLVPIVLEREPALARAMGTLTLSEVLSRFKTHTLVPRFSVEEGAEVLILSDREAFVGGVWIDIALALAAVERTLRRRDAEGVALRRRTSVLVHSGGVRNLHDLAFLLGLGADAVAPWLMEEKALALEGRTGLANLLEALRKGLEKVISTMGIHELRGYGKIFSSLGLKPELAEYFGTRNFYASEEAGYGFFELERTLLEREGFFRAEKVPPAKDFRFNPRVYKAAQEVSSGQAPYSHFQEKVRSLERESPVAARQLLEVRFPEKSPVSPEEVDLSVGGHSLPFVISAMSFGSQGEAAFRAY
ncbi:MAG: glutamate synthase, partial [Thermus sp.]